MLMWTHTHSHTVHRYFIFEVVVVRARRNVILLYCMCVACVVCRFVEPRHIIFIFNFSTITRVVLDARILVFRWCVGVNALGSQLRWRKLHASHMVSNPIRFATIYSCNRNAFRVNLRIIAKCHGLL